MDPEEALEASSKSNCINKKIVLTLAGNGNPSSCDGLNDRKENKGTVVINSVMLLHSPQQYIQFYKWVLIF